MTLVEERAYDFRTVAQWAAGARDNLRADGTALAVPPRLVAEILPGTGRADGSALLATDFRGGPLWLRPRTGELASLSILGVTEEGILAGPRPARQLVGGRALVWVLADGVAERYRRSTRQRLTPYAPPPPWRISAIAGDAADGLWAVEVDGSGHARLRHLDCWGRTTHEPMPVDAGSIAATADGTRLVLLDPAANTVSVRDTGTGQVIGTYALDPVYQGQPTVLAVGADDRIHLLGAKIYESLNLADGGVEDHQDLPIPPGLGDPTGLAATGSGLVVAATGGLCRIVPRDGGDHSRRSTFITPALVSPLGVSSGWNRAEIDAVLPTGTAMEVAWAATDDAGLVARATTLLDGPVTAGRAVALEALLPWREDEAVTYCGVDGGDTERLAALLNGITESTLWLRLRLLTPPGRTPPRISRLLVRYPDVSLIDELPALYREQPRSAADLRRILAPYEVLLDGLDEKLDDLPGRIDPSTATDEWTAYLLSWLGFPPLADLAADRRRALLAAAAAVLDGRGTRDGLERLLEVVTGAAVAVTDAATEPAGWFLGGPPARLGHDTVALAQLPAPARAGAMVLGDTPIGWGCPDPARMLAERAGVITIDLDLDPARQRALTPIIERFLPVFVPAHCRVRLRYRRAVPGRLLDDDLRLAPPDGDRLSTGTRPGRWTLPRPLPHSAVLDDAPELGAHPRLQ